MWYSKYDALFFINNNYDFNISLISCGTFNKPDEVAEEKDENYEKVPKNISSRKKQKTLEKATKEEILAILEDNENELVTLHAKFKEDKEKLTLEKTKYRKDLNVTKTKALNNIDALKLQINKRIAERDKLKADNVNVTVTLEQLEEKNDTLSTENNQLTIDNDTIRNDLQAEAAENSAKISDY